jgi:hypothetical protein
MRYQGNNLFSVDGGQCIGYKDEQFTRELYICMSDDAPLVALIAK